MRPGYKPPQSTNQINQSVKSTGSRPLPEKPIQQKEIKTEKQNNVDVISNKLREGIDEMITNITILSNKSVEMENTNKELIEKMKETEQIKSQFNELMKRINTLENQNQKQQKLIDHLSLEIDGQSSLKKNEKDEWIKQDKERIEQIMKEMKLTQLDLSKKEYDLKMRKEEADKYVEDQKKIRNEMNSMKKQVNENKNRIDNQSEVIETNQEVIESHNKQFDEIWNEMENRKVQMELLIESNNSLNMKEKKLMKDEIYCEIVEKTKETIEQLQKNGGKGLDDRMKEIENQMKMFVDLKNEIAELKQMKSNEFVKEVQKEVIILEDVVKKDDMINEIYIRMNEINNKIQ